MSHLNIFESQHVTNHSTGYCVSFTFILTNTDYFHYAEYTKVDLKCSDFLKNFGGIFNVSLTKP